MQPYPHHYVVTAHGFAVGDVGLNAGLPAPLLSASPAEFGGPGDRWSPETLLVAAVGDCLILTFRAVSRASGIAWTSFDCDVTGTLDRVEGRARFVSFEIRARLQVPSGTDPERARRALDKAEQNCVIANSLNATIRVIPTIDVSSERFGELTPA